MTDETKTKETIEEPIEPGNPGTAEEEKSADKTSAKAEEKKVAEHVENHDAPDFGKQLTDIIEGIARIEARPSTRIYLRRKSATKETSDGIQAEKKTDSKTGSKKQSGKIRLWRRF